MPQTELTWNLTDLYPTDADTTNDIEWLKKECLAFNVSYKNQTHSLSADQFAQMLEEYNKIAEVESKLGSYAELKRATEQNNPEVQAFATKTEELLTGLGENLIFFSLELIKLDDNFWQTVALGPKTQQYHHFLQEIRKEKPHVLTEPEENILLQKSLTSSSAWINLYDRLLANLVIPWQEKEISLEELLTLFYDPSRETRKQAAETLSKTLDALKVEAPFIFNTLLQDKTISDKLRHYDYPEQPRFESDEVSSESVKTLIDVVVANYPSVARYYKLKAQALGINDLAWYDRYAPISPVKRTVSYEEATKTVIDSYAKFSPQFAQIATQAIDQGWIDVMPKVGKVGGAFCADSGPSFHPYILLNFTETVRDVMTIAHELGHAVHDVFAGKHNKILQLHPSLAIAEMASVFGEALVFESFVNNSENRDEKLGLIAQQIEDIIPTVFRQVSMYQFEQAVHAHRRTKGELSPNDFNQLWNENIGRPFGDSLALDDNHAKTWMYVSHVFHSPFYVYSYAFGQLLTLGLYSRYKTEGESFVPRYINALSMGGSASPAEIMKSMDIDVTDKNFWQAGLDQFTNLVDQFEGLVLSHNPLRKEI